MDGTLLSALPEIVQASWLKETTGSGLVKWRLHTHFEVDRYIPTRMDVTPNGGGEHDERSVLERTIDVHVRALRQKLAGYAELVETVRGVGYRFRDPSAA